MLHRRALPFAALALLACSRGSPAAPTDDAGPPPGDASSTVDATTCTPDTSFTPPTTGFCATPGAVVFDARGAHTVGCASGPSLSWLNLPAGFCAHHYAHVPVARLIRFAPGGELFVASPKTATTGGGTNGLGAIAVVPDDDKDFVGDTTLTFAPNLVSTQGMLFANGFFYYQDATKIMRVPYKTGDRAMTGTPEQVADIAPPSFTTSVIHWPKAIDVADDGTVYVSNGGDQGDACEPSHPMRGGIVKLDPTADAGASPVAKGLRNPIALRCRRGKNRCFATELSRDATATLGGREKLIPLSPDAGVDDWGFPCCATKDTPYSDLPTNPPIDCSGVVPENVSFVIGNTPFGFDFEPGNFPSPWKGSIFVALHGEFGTWRGAQIVAIATDATTGAPLSGTMLDGGPSGAMSSFAQGWDDGKQDHGRPSDVSFAPDGRMFVADDVNGEIFWIAPVGN